MRNPVACISCRSAKQKCIHNDKPPCERCKATSRADSCQFPPPGTSSIHRQPKRPRCDSPQASSSTSPSNTSPSRRADTSIPANVSAPPVPPLPVAFSSPPTIQLASIDPFDLLTDEAKSNYLRCSYKWSFDHIPTLLLRIHNRSLESWVVWAMLALATRFAKEAPKPFKTQTEASNAFAAHARHILQSDLETPSISRVQALLMLVGHDWGAGNGRRAWIYLGMAIRMVQIMDLCQELSYPKDRSLSREEFIQMEERRRTAWTCFLMDSLLSGGKGRKRSLDASDMFIQLPCEQANFMFGEAVRCENLDGNLHMPVPSLPVGELGIMAYTLRAANIWGLVARWACSNTVNSEFPWAPTSEFQRLVYALNSWKNSLPERLQYDIFTLRAHNAVGRGQAFCYMYSIHFMSSMFLHRAYLPVLGPHNDQSKEVPRPYEDHLDTWKHWQKLSRTELVREATLVCEMLEEMRTLGVFFLRGLVPWIGFTVYTAVGVMLYSYNFPSEDDGPSDTQKALNLVIQGCIFLKEMKCQWPMAQQWFETIKRMQAFYRTAQGEDESVLPDERRELHRALVDYGALQPSPVQKAQQEQTSMAKATHDNTVSGLAPISPTNSTPFGSAASLVSPRQTLLVSSDNSFDLDFDFANADFEDMMVNATQGFWASFPGEVGYN